MKLYTHQVGRKYDYVGEKIDTTVKSGIKELAPTWDMVLRYKSKQITQNEYTYMYLSKLENEFEKNKKVFLDILSKDTVSLGCYCKPNVFCHRKLLVEVFKELALDNNIPFVYNGELDAKK